MLFIQSFVVCSLLALASAGILGHGAVSYANANSGALLGGLGGLGSVAHAPAPIGHAGLAFAPAAHAIDYYAPPRYAYNYEVNDALTGDVKSQTEHREGGVVKGQYSLVEPDGTLRVVNYAADDVNGFNAVVSRVGAAAHPARVALAPAAHLGAGLGAYHGGLHGAYHG